MHEFRLPGVMHFGWGAIEKVGEEASRLGNKAFLVTGRSSAKRTGALDKVRALLDNKSITAVVYDQVESDPSGETIDKGAQLARSENCDLVIGLGGGSPMDAARGIAAMAVLEGSIIDYVRRAREIDKPGLPLINIATTSGTASEVTPVAVVFDEERQMKMGVRSPYWFARVAITDPQLTLSMPPILTAATGLDALTHAVESYLSTNATPPSEALSLQAIELIRRHLPAAYRDGSDRLAREGMAIASMTAGMAFANAGLGLVHGLVHPLGARLGLSHGEACGRLLPLVMHYNATAVQHKIIRVGEALTGRRDLKLDDAINAIEAFVCQVGITVGIEDLDISADLMPTLAEEGVMGGAVRTNPIIVTKEAALAILEKARGGVRNV